MPNPALRQRPQSAIPGVMTPMQQAAQLQQMQAQQRQGVNSPPQSGGKWSYL